MDLSHDGTGPKQKFDVIVVLGAGLKAGGSASPTTKRRTAHGAKLFKEGRAGRVLLSGGRASGGKTEVDVMQDLVVAAGVPSDRIYLEPRSHSTFGNAVFSVRLMRKHGWKSALVVTDSRHMRRALFAFRRTGIRAVGSAASGPSDLSLWQRIGYQVHEIIGLILYSVLFLVRRPRPLRREQK